jgi:glycosyltransferase involved in cell wall biosynthesis
MVASLWAKLTGRQPFRNNCVNKKKILLAYPYDDPGTTPSLMALIETLCHDFTSVDLFCRSSDCVVEYKAGCVNIMRSRLSIWNPLRHIQGPAWMRRIVTVARNIWLWWRGTTILIGVDPEGLVYLSGINRIAARPLIYLSFELMITDELNEPERLFKQKEITISRRSPLVIIQDEERAGILRAENGLGEDIIAMLPNAPLPNSHRKSNFLRNQFDLNENSRIVLYAGNLAGWSGRDLFEELVSYWSDNFVLVINSRTPVSGVMRKYLTDLQKNRRIFFTPVPSKDDDILKLMTAADFGLAPYRPVPEGWASYGNMRHIGLSSGKVSYYAMCGLPILASALPAYCKAFTEYHAGAVYYRLADSGEMLAQLDSNYAFHSAESRRWYDEILNPTRSLVAIRDRLIHLT